MRVNTCRGCRKQTYDFLVSLLADGRVINLCRERGCAGKWLSASRA